MPDQVTTPLMVTLRQVEFQEDMGKYGCVHHGSFPEDDEWFLPGEDGKADTHKPVHCVARLGDEIVPVPGYVDFYGDGGASMTERFHELLAEALRRAL